MSRQEKKRKTSLGVLFWIAAILLILVVFLFSRRNIQHVMESTGLIEVINTRIGMDSEGGDLPPASGTDSVDPTNGDINGATSAPDNPTAAPSTGDTASDAVSGTATDTATDNTAATADPSPSDSEQNATGTAGTSSNTEDSGSTTDAASGNSHSSDAAGSSNTSGSSSAPASGGEKERNYLIHLVKVAANGDISLSAVEEPVDFIDSPLTKTLETLIDEPAKNSDGSLLNLIPKGTSLNRVWIKDGIAYIDLSEDFRFNPMGAEGQRLQLEQIVLTATQFGTVNGVQFLIDGKTLDFLGGEGTYIGKPLYPADF